MANGGHSSAALAPPAPAPPPAPLPSTTNTAEVVQSKRDLTSWWKNFKRGNPAKPHEEKAPQGIFGVPLQTSIRYANVAISLFNEQGQSYIYGYVPIVVAKCGVFLKEKATDVEGIFRLSGSEKRIKELRIAFDSPDRYGKGLDWSGYTVHDAANILRRYFNQLPEPIIPLEFYQRFRDPLKNHQAQAVGSMDLQGPIIGHFDPVEAIRIYQALITELPPLNRQLLLYILDLLAVFASKSDLNKMTTPNLAAIFQPGLLSHPQHDMAPAEYRLSQDVLIFLIENQDSFLIGMHGTAADEKTVKEVQSGAPTPRAAPSSPTTPGRSKTVLGRSSSNASAGADSVRRFGNLRRNVSVSSRASKRSNNVQGQVTPTLGSPTNSGGIHRSNTVPSKRSGASPRFPREKSSEPPTPSPGSGPLPPSINTAAAAAAAATPTQARVSEEHTPIAPTARPETVVPITAPALAAVASAHGASLATPEVISASSSEATTPLAAHGSETMGLLQRETTRSSTAPLSLIPPNSDRKPSTSERSPSGTPSRVILDFLKPSPASSDGEKKDSRKPNKLQKKRIPGSALSSAQSSAHSLQHDPETMADYFATPTTPTFDSRAYDYMQDHGNDRSAYATAQTSPRFMTPQTRTETDTTLKPTVSPSHSFHSRASATDTSDADYNDRQPSSVERSERRHRWRFSQSAKSRDIANEQTGHLGSINGADQSKSTISSGSAAGGRPRRSFQDNHSHVTSDPESLLSDNDERKKGPMSWIRSKLAERKERDAERQRPRSPVKMLRDGHNDSRQSLNIPAEKTRGKSLEVARQRSPGPALQRLPPEKGGGVIPVQQAAVSSAPVTQSSDNSASLVSTAAQPAISSNEVSQSQATENRMVETETVVKHGQDQYPTQNTQA